MQPPDSQSEDQKEKVRRFNIGLGPLNFGINIPNLIPQRPRPHHTNTETPVIVTTTVSTTFQTDNVISNQPVSILLAPPEHAALWAGQLLLVTINEIVILYNSLEGLIN